MKKTIEIEIPEGYNDAKYNEETHEVEFVKKQKRPETWKEFCENYPVNESESYICSHSSVIGYGPKEFRYEKVDRNLFVNKKEAEAFLALMQLRQLRKAWVGDWEPDMNDKTEDKAAILNARGELIVENVVTYNSPLLFPDYQMAEDFLFFFRGLLETAKILI